MFSKTLQSITFLVFSLMVLYTPGVTSVDISRIPQCALNCGFKAYFSTHSTCTFDITCHFKNNYFIGVTKACYTSTCSPRDISRTRSWGMKTCAEAGVPIYL